jgi:3-dehydroquinate dehydratase
MTSESRLATLLDEKTALDIILTMLSAVQSPMEPDVAEAVAKIRLMAPHLDGERLKKQADAAVNVHLGAVGVLDDFTDHLDWLPARRGSINWRFWDRYEWYLRHKVGMAPAAVDAIDEVTTRVLERLEDPQRLPEWDRRGMVMGDVQSGKTSNYVGLICKAADAGYKFIVVLAGLHNNLRSQTQLRVDLGFLGFDTEKNLAFAESNKKVGVGALPQRDFADVVAHALTSSKPDGDFNTGGAKTAGVNPKGADPVILVVKKNKSVLSNLVKYLNGYADKFGDKLQLDIPAIVIDDEADNASVNTKALPAEGEDWSDDEVTAINRAVRELLMKFRRRAYVGYTATPYANIFIHSEAKTPNLGPDLFPAAFILTLPTPSNHVGPAEIFGLAEDRRTGTAAREGVPVVRLISDDEADGFMPPKHKMNHVPAGLPSSLNEALRGFVLACALRSHRGQGEQHQSMLIHVTRFVEVQKIVGNLVAKRIRELTSAMKSEGRTRDAELDRFKSLWERDFVPTTASTAKRWQDAMIQPANWTDVESRIKDVLSRIEVETINGEAADIQRYKAAEEAGRGCYLIAVGGDKLSRGLTLEGLTVSYFLRATKMYDTLMQMGRWFGYRPGYLDACRLYITEELRDWYQHLALVNIELRQDFDYMTSMGKRPADFGLRVRQHTSGMVITSASKMRPGRKLKVSFADSLAETTAFYREKAPNQGNLAVAADLVSRLGACPTTKRDGTAVPYFRWDGVAAKHIIEFLRGFKNHPRSLRSRPDLIAEFIELQNAQDELTSWTVAVVNNRSQTPERQYVLGFLTGGCTERNDANPVEALKEAYTLSKQHLISPDDELLDLSTPQRQRALEVTEALWRASSKKSKGDEAPKKPNGKGARAARPPESGLLLIYELLPDPKDRREDKTLPVTAFAISFPASENAKTVDYRVNNVYWNEEFGGEQ